MSAPGSGADTTNLTYVNNRTRTPLSADLNTWLTATGNDSNDGLSQSAAKKTWAGMQKLLDGIDPRGYKVTVNVRGLVSGGNVYAQQFNQHNLRIIGANRETDGFTSILTLFEDVDLDELNLFKLVTQGPYKKSLGTLRFTGNDASAWIIGTASNVDLSGTCTIEYGGSHTTCIISNAGVFRVASSGANTVKFVQLPGVSMTYFSYDSPGSSTSFYKTTFTGDVVPDEYSFYLRPGAILAGVYAQAPGGGTIYRASEIGPINALGVARAAGRVDASGILISSSFGVTSVTKTGTGTYSLQCGFTPGSALVSAANGTVSATWALSGSNVLAYTRNNASGALVDCSFSFIIF
jgi:hypothetical protein